MHLSGAPGVGNHIRARCCAGTARAGERRAPPAASASCRRPGPAAPAPPRVCARVPSLPPAPVSMAAPRTHAQPGLCSRDRAPGRAFCTARPGRCEAGLAPPQGCRGGLTASRPPRAGPWGTLGGPAHVIVLCPLLRASRWTPRTAALGWPAQSAARAPEVSGRTSGPRAGGDSQETLPGMWPQFPRLGNGELSYRLGRWDRERSLGLQLSCSYPDISHFDFLTWDPPSLARWRTLAFRACCQRPAQVLAAFSRDAPGSGSASPWGHTR